MKAQNILLFLFLRISKKLQKYKQVIKRKKSSEYFVNRSVRTTFIKEFSATARYCNWPIMFWIHFITILFVNRFYITHKPVI
jgi:hypothetical protein